jgi:hypothetical protein
MTGDIVEHLDDPGPGIDRDNAGVGRIGKCAGAAAGLVDRARLERRFFPLRQSLRMQVGGMADVVERHALRAEMHPTGAKRYGILGRLQQMRADALDFFAKLGAQALDTAPPAMVMLRDANVPIP